MSGKLLVVKSRNDISFHHSQPLHN